jgi:hypothetical protein
VSDDGRNVLGPIPLGPPTLGIVSEDNVITAKRRLSCFQEHIQVDEKNRRVTCGKCGREIDPIEALMILARDPDRWKEWIAHWQAKKQQAESELADLKRQISNAKATLRRTRPTPRSKP